MKNLLILFGLISQAMFAQSQFSGYDFLSRLPDLPTDVCGMTSNQRSQFESEVQGILDEINDVISKKNKQVKTDVENSKSQIEKNMMKDYNLSDADMQKLKNKKLSKEEKKKIADKMLQETTSLSMKEIENLKKMSKEGKKGWAEAYTDQKIANMTSGDSVKTEEQLEMEKTLKKNKNINDLAKEQKLITDRIAASDKKYMNRLVELDKEDSAATAILNFSRKPLLDKLNGIPEPPKEGEVREIINEVRELERIYCNQLSPHYIEIVKDALTALHSFMPDYQRLEEINAELNSAMLGVEKSYFSQGLMQLEAVQSYASKLQSIFKYANYTFPESKND